MHSILSSALYSLNSWHHIRWYPTIKTIARVFFRTSLDVDGMKLSWYHIAAFSFGGKYAEIGTQPWQLLCNMHILAWNLHALSHMYMPISNLNESDMHLSRRTLRMFERQYECYQLVADKILWYRSNVIKLFEKIRYFSFDRRSNRIDNLPAQESPGWRRQLDMFNYSQSECTDNNNNNNNNTQLFYMS